jgi:hypothetical protein
VGTVRARQSVPVGAFQSNAPATITQPCDEAWLRHPKRKLLATMRITELEALIKKAYATPKPIIERIGKLIK